MVVRRYSTKRENGEIVTVEGRGKTELEALVDIIGKARGDELQVIFRGALEDLKLIAYRMAA